MAYTLPPLPYPTDALQPVISREALELHHGAHHQAYVDKLNEALDEADWSEDISVEELIAKVETLPAELREPVRNFGGGHANHSLLWATMTPSPARPSDDLLSLIDRDFGSLVALRADVELRAGKLFGSGWIFLSWLPVEQKLALEALPNQDSPLMMGRSPILACDLWEHAHYIDFRNKRAEWVHDWWGLIDWRKVEERLDASYAADSRRYPSAVSA